MFNRNTQAHSHASRLQALGPITLAAALLLVASGNQAYARATIKISPQSALLHVSVNAQGKVSGQRKVTLSISRTEKPTGVFQSCKKVYVIDVSDGHGRIGRSYMQTPLCSFTNHRLTVSPFKDDDFAQACQDQGPGTVKRIIQHGNMVFWNNNYPDRSSGIRASIEGNSDYGTANPDVAVNFRAVVTCQPSRTGRPAGPRTGPGGGGRAQNCDFTGSWPVWLANGSRRQQVPFVADGKATVSIYRATPNSSRVEGHAFVRQVGGQSRLIVNLDVPGRPETFATFNGAFTNSCNEAVGEYYEHDGKRVTFEGHYAMQRFQGNATPVRSPVGRPTTNTPPIWHPRQLPQIPNWRKRP